MTPLHLQDMARQRREYREQRMAKICLGLALIAALAIGLGFSYWGWLP